MTSILKVDSIAHSNGTTAATISSSGETTFSKAVTNINPKLVGSAVSLNTLSHKDFTIPSGTNRFTITLDAAEGPSSGYLTARLGTSGGIISSSSYLTHNANFQSSSAGYGSTSGDAFLLSAWSNDNADMTGTMTFTHHGGNVWLMGSELVSPYYPTYFISFRGKISLGAECTTVRILPDTGNFDGGTANLLLG
tara:strand:+ start:47 stop:628 length:582 start_codon:yes stop_codon:yes gene_type:complete